MSSFALHPVSDVDDPPTLEPPDDEPAFPLGFDPLYGPLFDDEPSDDSADDPHDAAVAELSRGDEPFWGDGPASRNPAWAGMRYTDYAFEADLQRFCRSAALSRVARDYEGVAAARTLLEFARGTGDDELLRWGPSRVSAFLRGGDPQGNRRSVPDRENLLRVLRALIHYGHEGLGVDPAWSMLALAAVEAGADPYLHEPPYDPAYLQRDRLAALERLVGGADALAALDDTPLAQIDPTHPVHPPAGQPLVPVLPAALRARVDELLALTSGFADEHLDPEFATACATFVHRLAAEAPVALFRRDPTMTAAGVVWIVGRGNGLMQPHDAMHGRHVAEHFGVARGSYGRMHYLARDIGCALVGGAGSGLALVIPDPAMQLAATRTAILRARDELTAECRHAAARDGQCSDTEG